MEEHWCSTGCSEGGEPKRWESSELGRRKKRKDGEGVVSWKGWKGGRILRWQGQRGGRIGRWQAGKGGRVVKWQGAKGGRVVRKMGGSWFYSRVGEAG